MQDANNKEVKPDQHRPFRQSKTRTKENPEQTSLHVDRIHLTIEEVRISKDKALQRANTSEKAQFNCNFATLVKPEIPEL